VGERNERELGRSLWSEYPQAMRAGCEVPAPQSNFAGSLPPEKVRPGSGTVGQLLAK